MQFVSDWSVTDVCDNSVQTQRPGYSPGVLDEDYIVMTRSAQ